MILRVDDQPHGTKHEDPWFLAYNKVTITGYVYNIHVGTN